MIFQEPMAALNPLYSIGDQICEVLELHQAMTRAQARAAGDRAARAHPHQGAAAPLRQPAAPALRRPTAAGDDRDGARLQSQAGDRRRADHRARRHHPGADHGAAGRAAEGGRHGGAADHPRPAAGEIVRRAGRRDAPGPHRRARQHCRRLRGAGARIHAAADRCAAAADGERDDRSAAARTRRRC